MAARAFGILALLLLPACVVAPAPVPAQLPFYTTNQIDPYLGEWRDGVRRLTVEISGGDPRLLYWLDASDGAADKGRSSHRIVQLICSGFCPGISYLRADAMPGVDAMARSPRPSVPVAIRPAEYAPFEAPEGALIFYLDDLEGAPRPYRYLVWSAVAGDGFRETLHEADGTIVSEFQWRRLAAEAGQSGRAPD